MSKKKITIVIGAGFSGLSAALALLEKGYLVKILELGSKPGGIAAEIKVNGHLYEMGAHLFHCPDPLIMEDMKNLIGEDLIPIDRTIKVDFMGKYYDFPLKISEVFMQLPIKTVFAAGFSFLVQQIKPLFFKTKIKNSEDLLIKNYGHILYNIFFKNYIQRVWGIGPDAFSPKFAEQRIPNFNILEILYKVQNFLKKIFRVKDQLNIDNFVEKVEGELFTTKSGFSGIIDKMVKKIIKNGGEIIYESKVTKICLNSGGLVERIHYSKNHKDYKINVDGVISSIPLNILVNLIYPSKIRNGITNSISILKYRSLVFVGLIINRTNVLPASLTYFRDLSFNRITDLTSLGIKTKENGISTLVAEISCDMKDDIWLNPNLAKENVIADLVRKKIIQKSEIIDGHIYQLEHAYPIYVKGYDNALTNILNHLDQVPNLKTIGRNGRFQYINSHIAIRHGYDAGNQMIKFFDS